MKKYEQPLLEIETIVVEDTILSSTFGTVEEKAGDINVNLF